MSRGFYVHYLLMYAEFKDGDEASYLLHLKPSLTLLPLRLSAGFPSASTGDFSSPGSSQTCAEVTAPLVQFSRRQNTCSSVTAQRTPAARQTELPIFHRQNIVPNSGETGKREKGEKKGGGVKKREGGVKKSRRKRKIRGKKDGKNKMTE